jgi:AcrR family transcriptional regulator
MEAPPKAGESSPRAGELTAKAQRTREHIVDTALGLFADKGYPETTLRDIAAAAGVSLGLTYRYFSRKEELVLELYIRIAGALDEEVRALPAEPMARRFVQAVRMCLARLSPHRVSLSALFGTGLDPDSEVAVLGDRVAPIRTTVWRTYLTVVTGASDAPKERQARQLATLLYAAHLLFVLFWLQDRSPGQTATEQLLDFAQEMIGRLRPVLGLPIVARPFTRLAGILTPMFGPAEEGESAATSSQEPAKPT